MKRYVVSIVFLIIFGIILTSCSFGSSDTEVLFGGGLSRDTADPDDDQHYPPSDALSTHIRVSSGEESIHPYGCLLWSKLDNGDGTYTESIVDKYDVIDLVSGKTSVPLTSIPTLKFDGTVTLNPQVNAKVDSISVITRLGQQYVSSTSNLDELSALPEGEYYVVLYVSIGGNCTPDAQQNGYRYEDVFRLVVEEGKSEFDRDIDSLRQSYPEYFGLGTFKGLEVYVWYDEDGRAFSGAMTGTNRMKTEDEIRALANNGASILEMSVILSTYGNDVFVSVWGTTSHGEDTVLNMTIAETLPSCLAFEDGYCFYAYDVYGSLYRVLWTDHSKLEEKCRVKVYFTFKKMLVYDEPASGWSPMFEVTATKVEPYSRSYVKSQDDLYEISLPDCEKNVKLGRDYIKYVPYIYDDLIDKAVEKLSESVKQYDNNSGHYLSIDKDGYLCLSIEVIAPLSEGESGGCSDHKHIFFSERISSVGLKDDGPISSYIPPQPQRYDTLDFAVTSIYKGTIPSGDQDHAEAYKQMLSAFSGEGYIYEAVSGNHEREQFVFLIPETNYEDIGVSYYFNSGNAAYQVLIYSTQNAKNISSLEKYYVSRFGAFSYIEEYQPSGSFADTLYIYETADGKICARAQIDKTHYTEIRADKDKVGFNTLKSFISTLSFKQKKIEYLP